MAYQTELDFALDLARQAGATVTDLDGNPVRYDAATNGVLASNGKIHDQLIDLIKRSV